MNTATKVLLVLLRIAVGWHFLYEGIFKMEQDGFGPPAPGARHFLQTSVAKLRESSGPDVAARVDAWNDQVQRFFKAQNNELSNEQRAALDTVCEQLKRDPEKIRQLDWIYIHGDVLQVTPPPEAESFSSEGFLRASTGPFRGVFRGLIADADGLGRLTKQDAQERIDERYEQIVRHYESAGYPLTSEQRSKLAQVRDALKASVAATLDDPSFRARLDDYKLMLGRVNAAGSQMPFLQERLTADTAKLEITAKQLLAFVEEPLMELAAQSSALATAEQLNAGSPPKPSSPTAIVDALIMWSLALIGFCLLAGLFTQPAAIGAAGILLVFYLASPPWPGLPVTGTEGHYVIVNRNLIELVAALLLVTARAGQWAGLDAYLGKWKLMRLPQFAAQWMGKETSHATQ